MNSSKNIINQNQPDSGTKKSASAPKTEGTEKKKKKKRGGGFLAGRQLKPIILTTICIVVVVVLCVGVGVQQAKPKVAVTVGDTQIKLNDMMYPFYELESTYLPYNEMYEAYMGTTIWDYDYSGDAAVSGVSNSVGWKQEILEAEVQYEIMYQLAVDGGYALTDEEEEEAEDEAKEALTGLSALQKARLYTSEKKLTERLKKIKLGDKYKADKVAELNATVDEDALIADISREDYREYDVEYFVASLTTTDDDGETVDLNDSELSVLRSKMEGLKEQGESADGFSEDMLDEDEEDIYFYEDGFTEQDGWSAVTQDQLTEIKAMGNGEISAVLETESSYILVRMVDNNSSQAYDEACDEVITEAQDEVFSDWYDGQQEDFAVNVNSDVWSDVLIGYMTTDIVTLEDIERMEEEASSDVSS